MSVHKICKNEKTNKEIAKKSKKGKKIKIRKSKFIQKNSKCGKRLIMQNIEKLKKR